MEDIGNELVYPVEAVYAVSETLRRIDMRLMDHGERVAYMTRKLNEYGNFHLDEKKLFLLSLFHDIGAYKTEEIDRMLEFESKNVQNHSIYGYLFLKYMSPLRECAEAVLYHHTKWDKLQKIDSQYKEYAILIQLCDRIDVASGSFIFKEEILQQVAKCKNYYKPEFLACALSALQETSLLEEVNSSLAHEENLDRCRRMNISASEALEYLKMIVYSIDFRSENTVTHTVNTVSLALNIAHHFMLERNMFKKIYIGALLHDVGKIAIPISILEYPGRLDAQQMAVMRTHVDETEKIIGNIVPKEVSALSLAHHEKLDGSGYPLGLTGRDLSFPQRIIAVADIVSALSSERSYKEPFPKEKTIGILRSMEKERLDASVCDYICDKYDEIMKSTDEARRRIIGQYKSMKDEYEHLIQ